MPNPAVGVIAAQIGSSLLQSKSARKASKAGVSGQEGAIGEQRAARQEFRELSQPFLTAGRAGIDPLLELLRLSGGDPLTGLEEINPLVSFLRDQGFEDIQESAAGRGFTGGTLNELSEFNTQLAGTIVPNLQQQRFNQLFDLVRLGSNTATGVGTAGLSTATNIGTGLTNIGNIRGQGILQQGDITTSGINSLASIFGFNQGGGFNFLNSGGGAGNAGANAGGIGTF